MRKLKITSLTLLLGLVVFSSCNPGGDPEPSAEEKQTALLAKTWKAGTAASDITLDNANEVDNWSGFTVSFSATGSYTTANVSQGREDVWPSQGSWAYENAGAENVNVNRIIRDAGTTNETIITITVTETSLRMTFDYTDPTGRVGGTEGAWVFNMDE